MCLNVFQCVLVSLRVFVCLCVFACLCAPLPQGCRGVSRGGCRLRDRKETWRSGFGPVEVRPVLAEVAVARLSGFENHKSYPFYRMSE